MLRFKYTGFLSVRMDCFFSMCKAFSEKLKEVRKIAFSFTSDLNSDAKQGQKCPVSSQVLLQTLFTFSWQCSWHSCEYPHRKNWRLAWFFSRRIILKPVVDRCPGGLWWGLFLNPFILAVEVTGNFAIRHIYPHLPVLVATVIHMFWTSSFGLWELWFENSLNLEYLMKHFPQMAT